MGLLFRRRRPLITLAAGAAVGGMAYHAGRRREDHDMIDEHARATYSGTSAAPAPLTAPPAATDPTSGLERLAGLHQSGALTDAEFTAAKSRLLGV